MQLPGSGRAFLGNVMTLAQERLADCTSRHRDAAIVYWSDKRQVAYVVTLAGKRRGNHATHDYHVLAGDMAGAIRTAMANNMYLDGKARFVKARLCCPCDAWRT